VEGLSVPLDVDLHADDFDLRSCRTEHSSSLPLASCESNLERMTGEDGRIRQQAGTHGYLAPTALVRLATSIEWSGLEGKRKSTWMKFWRKMRNDREALTSLIWCLL
jgi:hypothetical protein